MAVRKWMNILLLFIVVMSSLVTALIFEKNLFDFSEANASPLFRGNILYVGSLDPSNYTNLEVQPDQIPFGTVYRGSTIEGSFMIKNATQILSIDSPSWVIIGNTFGNVVHSWGTCCIIHFSVNTISNGNFSDAITVETDAGIAQLPVMVNIREMPPPQYKLLVTSSPFNLYSTDNGTHFNVMTRIMSENYINASYTENIPAVLAGFDGIILAEESLAWISLDEIARIENYIDAGGKLLVFADYFFRGTVESANLIINDYGLDMIDEEESGEVIVSRNNIISDKITNGISLLRFWRPSPISNISSVGKILVEKPSDTTKGYIAISRGNGTVIAVGDSLWWCSFLLKNFSYHNNKLFTNMLYERNISPNVAYVDDDFNSSTPGWGYDHFDKIQHSIDAVSKNGTVYVYNGTYYENVDVNKTINLIGENKETTIIDGGGGGNVVYITADWVNISGFTIRNSGGWPNAGVKIYANNITIHSCKISDNSWNGIDVYSSHNNSIYNCKICDNYLYGVWFKTSRDISMYGNNVSNNTYGIALYNSSNAIIWDNNFCCNTFDIEIVHSICNQIYSNNAADITFENSTKNKIYKNNIDFIDISYGNSNNICGNNITGITLWHSIGNIVCNNTINGSDIGIGICNYSNNNIISNNSITNNSNEGIGLWHAYHNTIYNNKIANNNWSGIELSYSDDNTIYNCDITGNNWYGIELDESNNNSIYNCNISNNQRGIWLYSSSNNSIYNCNVSNNDGGIKLVFSSNNEIYNCNISNNDDGIELDESSDNNIIYNNIFSNVYNAYDEGNNAWNISKIVGKNIVGGNYIAGNYWHGYNGSDTNGDGIGDEPYHIAGGNNTDWLPLVRNVPPIANFTWNPLNPTDLDTIHFIDESNDMDGNIVSWYWQFGDGSTSTLQNPSHQYPDDGTYNVTLTVRDNNGNVDTVYHLITVLNEPPTAYFTWAYITGDKEYTIQFTDLSKDFDGDIVSWFWQFGDGNISTDENPTHFYRNYGTYQVNLTVTDDDGDVGYVSRIIELSKNYPPEKPINIEPSNQSINVDINVVLKVKLIDLNNDTMSARFYDANNGTLIASIDNVKNGSVAEVLWSGLDYNTTYYWYVIANDSKLETKSDIWSFTTIFGGEKGAIKGRVVDPDIDKGIKGVDVELYKNNYLVKKKLSGFNGKYIFYDITPDSYIIKAQRIDSMNKIMENINPRSLDVSWGYTTIYDIEMGSKSNHLSFNYILLNNENDFIKVHPGEKVNCKLNYTVWSQSKSSTKIMFVIVGIGNNANVIYQGKPGDYPGYAGEAEINVTTPHRWETLHIHSIFVFAEDESEAIDAYRKAESRLEIGKIEVSGLSPITFGFSIGVLFSGLFALFIMITEPGKYKFFTTFVTPLFTRISKSEALESPTRDAIYGYLQENPGAHYNQIKRDLGLPNGVLSHHLHMLEKLELVKSQRVGIQYLIFRPYGIRVPEEKVIPLTKLQKSIMEIVKENEGITQKEIADRLGKKQQTISYNLRELERRGKISTEKRGRERRYYPVEE